MNRRGRSETAHIESRAGRHGAPGPDGMAGILPANSPASRLPGPTRRRRPGVIAGLVFVVVAFAALGVLLVRQAGRTTEVLVAARPLPVGQRISAADLETARVSASGVRAISAEDLDTVVGQAASVPLVRGQLLNRDMVTTTELPQPGGAMVGAALRAGQLPGDGLEPGDHVRVLAVPGKDSAAADGLLADPRVLAERAIVFAVRADAATGGSMIVTLLVPDGQASQVATYSSAGELGLVEVPR